ncbi:unnamed protein product, partial [Prunus brigantina]
HIHTAQQEASSERFCNFHRRSLNGQLLHLHPSRSRFSNSSSPYTIPFVRFQIESSSRRLISYEFQIVTRILEQSPELS